MAPTSINAATWYRRLAGEETPGANGWGLFAFRVWAVLWLGVTYRITWPAWMTNATFTGQPRTCPLLPLWDSPAIPQFDVYWPLLITLGIVLVCARLGIILHSLILLYAILADQTRLQPEVISPVILLAGTLVGSQWQTLAGLHLATMWFYAGLHKLLATGYEATVANRIFNDLLHLPVDEEQARFLGIAAACLEILIGLFAFLPILRRVAAIAGIGMHLVIFLSATPLPNGISALLNGDWGAAVAAVETKNWVQPVWPWNLLLLAAGPAFLWSWQTSLRVEWRAHGWLWRATAAALLISPLTYYWGWINPYLAHCLFSGNVVFANTVTAEQIHKHNGNPPYSAYRNLSSPTLPELGISLPPSERMCERFFEKTARSNDELLLSLPTALSWRTGVVERRINNAGGEKINDKQKSGFWREYYLGGFGEGNFHDNREHGHWIYYREDGTQDFEGDYDHGQYIGTWRFYDPDGSVRENKLSPSGMEVR